MTFSGLFQRPPGPATPRSGPAYQVACQRAPGAARACAGGHQAPLGPRCIPIVNAASALSWGGFSWVVPLLSWTQTPCPGSSRPSGDPARLQGDRGRTSSLPGLSPLGVGQLEAEGHAGCTWATDAWGPGGPMWTRWWHCGPNWAKPEWCDHQEPGSPLRALGIPGGDQAYGWGAPHSGAPGAHRLR